MFAFAKTDLELIMLKLYYFFVKPYAPLKIAPRRVWIQKKNSSISNGLNGIESSVPPKIKAYETNQNLFYCLPFVFMTVTLSVHDIAKTFPQNWVPRFFQFLVWIEKLVIAKRGRAQLSRNIIIDPILG